MVTFLTGLGVGFSLILAIGAQNAFVLKQGLKREYVFSVCLICALSDSILIYLGITGFSKIVVEFHLITIFAQYFGALFLFIYGLKSFYSAFRKNTRLDPSRIEKANIYRVLGTCLAFTWLNPHVYLDTVVLVGSISTNFTDELHTFAIGAILSSWIFFFSLGYGAKFLLPLFQNSISWKILDFLIGVIMWVIAINLLY
jgi:L-lysine exporter family protein LysE/ArgO